MLSRCVSKIYETAEEIDLLLRSSKHGKWEKVLEILGDPDNPRKSYLINCIPENRRWGILHQAAYWNNHQVVRKLVHFKACDIWIKAKEGESEMGQDGKKTAAGIAEDFQRTKIFEYLKKKQGDFKNYIPDTPETFHLYDEEFELEYCLLTLTLASYKTSFLPPSFEGGTFDSLLHDVWKKIDTKPGAWEVAQRKVAEAVYVVCEETHQIILECTDKNSFYKAIICAYTDEWNNLYYHLDSVLRRQRHTDYQPRADDLALGPYVLMYQLLLLFWSKLHKERRVTYRKMKISPEDLDKYKVGTKFVWMSFVSSSVELKTAERFPTRLTTSGDRSVVFKIDNSSSCPWQPRNIEKYAKYMEEERVYPAGAKFLVTERTEDEQQRYQTNISLKLLK